MKKLLLIFLLVILPFQFSWAAAAAYCQHEEGQTVQHFGHHSHQHQAKADKTEGQSGSLQTDTDCGYCHLSCQASVPAAPPDIPPAVGPTYTQLPPLSYSSHIPDGPRRPDRRLAA